MMKLIEDPATIAALREGQVIATADGPGMKKFEIKSVAANGYIIAIHTGGSVEVKIIPQHRLLAGWWAERDPANL